MEIDSREIDTRVISPLAYVLARLTNVRQAAGGHVATCPAHADRHHSLKVSTRSDGSVLVHCHAGCTTAAVLAAIDLTFIELFTRRVLAEPPLWVM